MPLELLIGVIVAVIVIIWVISVCVTRWRFQGGVFVRSASRDRKFNQKIWGIVTGSNVGIGLETAKVLASKGMNIVIGCRNENKARAAMKEIDDFCQSVEERGKVRFYRIDLKSRASIDEFVSKIEKMVDEEKACVPCLINNAGMVFKKTTFTDVYLKDGGVAKIEDTYLVNYFHTAYLTESLLPTLKKCSDDAQYGRIINLSSIAHASASQTNLDMINDYKTLLKIAEQRAIQVVSSYCGAKLALSLYTKVLASKLASSRYLKAVSLHPGWIDSDFLTRHVDNCCENVLYQLFYWFFGKWAMITVPQGAQTTIHLAVVDADSADFENGEFHLNCQKNRIGFGKRYFNNIVEKEIQTEQLWQATHEFIQNTVAQ